MSHSRLVIAAAIIAGLIVLDFVLSVPHTRDALVPHIVSETPATTPAVALADSFKKGTHTITGSIEAPTPCTSLSADAVPVGTASSTTGILVEIVMPEDTGICLKEPLLMHFSATIVAPPSLPISVTVNGITATTTGS